VRRAESEQLDALAAQLDDVLVLEGHVGARALDGPGQQMREI